MVQRIQVESIEHLVKLLKDGNNDYFIALAGGHARSSKYIQYNEDDCKPFSVNNEIDGTEDMFSVDELKSSHIGEAISKKSFYCEIYGVEEEPKDDKGYEANVRIVNPATCKVIDPSSGQFIRGDNSTSTLRFRLEMYDGYMKTIKAMAEQLIRDSLEAFTKAFSCDTVCFDPEIEPEPDAGYVDDNGYASCLVEKVWIGKDGNIMLGLYVMCDGNIDVTCDMSYRDVCDVDVTAVVNGIVRQIESGKRDVKVNCAHKD